MCYAGCRCRYVGLARKSFFCTRISHFSLLISPFFTFHFSFTPPPLCLRSPFAMPSLWVRSPDWSWNGFKADLERYYNGPIANLQKTGRRFFHTQLPKSTFLPVFSGKNKSIPSKNIVKTYKKQLFLTFFCVFFLFFQKIPYFCNWQMYLYVI